MRIVRLANFVAPHSGGLRTSLAELGAGYLAAGHEPVLVIPGGRDGDERCVQGRVITLRAPRVPFTGGYRVLWRRRRLARLLAALRPDALEVSDRTTLRWTGAWAREHGVPAVMVSHESVTALLKLTLLGPALAGTVADWLNRRTTRAYHRVICTTSWVVGEAGASVPGEDLAAGVRAVLARPERSRRAAARARAEQYDWGTAVRGFLAAHGAADSSAIRRRSA
jgi:alpha-1,6-mannosyltransferase